MLSNPHDFICLSEHWMSEVSLGVKRIKGFSPVSSFCRSDHKGGGVALYVSDKLLTNVKVIDVTRFCLEMHHEFACVALVALKLLVVGVYRPPDGNMEAFISALEVLVLSLVNFRSKYNLIVGGDFNIDVLDVENPRTVRFCDVLRSLNLYCTNFQPTRYDACLDNVATDLSHERYGVEVVSWAVSDHDPVSFAISRVQEDNSSPLVKLCIVAPLTQARVLDFTERFSHVDWPKLMMYSDAEKNFNTFFNVFLNIFNLCFPLKCVVKPQVSLKKKSKPQWITPEILVKKKWVIMAYDVYKVKRTQQAKTTYNNLKKEYRLELQVAKQNFNGLQIQTATNPCSAAWRIIRSETEPLTAKSTSVSPDTFNNFFLDSVQAVRDQFGAPEVTAAQLMNQSPQVQTKLKWRPVGCDDVIKVVRSMKNTKSKDVHNISSEFLKCIITSIAWPLTYCFNHCMLQGVFPACLKKSKVVPVYKKGAWDEPGSFRPISLVPILSKVFESLLKSQLCSHFEGNGLFSASQYGFRSGLSTVDAVDSLIQHVLSSFESGGFAGATLCDLSKAFDTVDHGVLLCKLNHYGICGVELQLLRSYLGGREQLVAVNGQCSRSRPVAHGVPQGSVLGPLLFIIMMNDLPSHVEGGVVCYADDTTLVHSSNDVQNLVELMEQSLVQASVWFQANFLSLNETKTQSLVFTLKNIKYDVTSVKLLGIVIDTKLTWGPHITLLCSKLFRVIFLLRNLKSCLNKNCLKQAYLAFFQGTLLYGLRLWGGSTEINKVLLVQKRAVRILANAEYDAPCRPLFVNEGIMTVCSLYVFVSVVHIKNDLQSLSLRGDQHMYNTRNRNMIDVPYVRLRKTQRNSNHLSMNLLNHINCTAWNQTNEKFRNNLRALLLAFPLYKISDFFNIPKEIVSEFFNVSA